jgi:Protein of unknown function (DUF2845)
MGMARISIGLLAAVLAALALARPALAELECEGRMFAMGAAMADVLQACGEPARRVRSEQVRDTGLFDSPISGEVRIPVEEWTYERPGQFTQKVIFEAGRLVKVETGGYPDLEGP